MRQAWLVLIMVIGLGACGGGNPAPDPAEQARLAAAHACLKAAAVAFNGTLGQTLGTAFGSVEGVDLSDCPADLKAPFTAYKYALRDALAAYNSYSQNESGREDACKLGAGLTILELLTGQSTGQTQSCGWFGAASHAEHRSQCTQACRIRAAHRVCRAWVYREADPAPSTAAAAQGFT